MRFVLLPIFAILLAGIAFASTSDCADGTKYFKCSTVTPGYLCGATGLVLYTKQCPCSDVPGWVQTGEGDTATCILAKCSDGTSAGACSATKPKECVQGVLLDNAAKCGCPSGKRMAADSVHCEFIPCTDNGVNVPSGTCSPKKERKCVDGVLVNKASECGCPLGKTMDGESCIFVCSDGTKENQCSATLPKECVNGYLIDNASKCGCPEGKTASGKYCTDSILGAVAGADILSGASGETEAQAEGSSGGTGALSCCCLPAALIGVAGGYVFVRKRE